MPSAAIRAVVIALGIPCVGPFVIAFGTAVVIEEHHTIPASTKADFIELVWHSSQ